MKRTKKLVTAYIARAQQLGSAATTLRGAGRYLIAQSGHAGLVTVDELLAGAHPSRRYSRADWNSGTRKAHQGQRWSERVNARKSLPRAAEELARDIVDRNRATRARERLEAIGASALARLGWDTAGLRDIADDLCSDWPFRRSTSGWAGGEHSVSVHLSDLASASGESEKVWSDNGKWSGTNSNAALYATPSALIWFPELRTPDGSIVLDAERIARREYAATWVAQSRGMDLKTVEGWIIRGYHVQARTIEQARAKAAAARAQQLDATIRARDDKRNRRVELADYKSVYIDLADSTRAGNCSSMSQQFAAQVWRKLGASGPCAVRADIVLRTRDDTFTRRALAMAIEHAPALTEMKATK